MTNNNNDGSTTSEFVELLQDQGTEEKQRYSYQFGKKRLHLTEKEAEFINKILEQEEIQREWGKEIDPTIPWNRATFSWEYRKCASPYCKCNILGGDFRHGPYLVMVWKDLDSKKIKKKYLGKSKDGDMNIDKVLHDLNLKKEFRRLGILSRDFTMTGVRKGEAIIKAAENGNKLAEEYRQKLDNHKVTVDWAYKKVFKLNNNQVAEKSNKEEI
jgi:hypothetical protein